VDKATLRGLVLAIGRDPNPDLSRDLSREEDGATVTGCRTQADGREGCRRTSTAVVPSRVRLRREPQNTARFP
jgi:hypothetical protein